MRIPTYSTTFFGNVNDEVDGVDVVVVDEVDGVDEIEWIDGWSILIIVCGKEVTDTLYGGCSIVYVLVFVGIIVHNDSMS